MELVSAIVVNYNGLSDLPGCLESLIKQEYPEIELIIVDNSSNDGSREFLRDFVANPRVAERFHSESPFLIENEANVGFSAAMNAGIRISRGSLILSLNTDVVLEPRFVGGLVCAMSDGRVGSSTGKLLRFPPGKRGNPVDSVGHLIFKNRLARNIGEGIPGDGAFQEGAEVFGTCGAAAMYRREMLEDIRVEGEYFDEHFFSFWEDLDVDWRAALRGWKCVYNPDAVAYHRRGGMGYRKSLLVEFHNFKNRYLLMIKNDCFLFILKNLPGIVFTEILKGGALLFRCPRALLSLFEVAKLLPIMLRKRKIIQSRRIVPPHEIEKRFEPFDYARWIERHLIERGRIIA